MSSDERTRLRIRQYLTELMDEEAADAMMESMPPIPWTELATKSDLAQLEAKMHGRLDHVDGRLDRIEGRLDRIDERFDEVRTGFVRVDERFDEVRTGFVRVDERFDEVRTGFVRVDERFDEVRTHFDELNRNVGAMTRAFTMGLLSLSVVLLLFVGSAVVAYLTSGV